MTSETEAVEDREDEPGKRWLVMGGSGAGKSTFSRELANVLGVPVIHLDKEYWKPGWIERPKPEWQQIVAELSTRESWVIDGNYSGTLELRLPRTHTVVLLDPPTWQCFIGIWSRAFSQRGTTRADMAEGCVEKLPDWEFMWWVVSYKWRSRPKVLRMIASAPEVRLHHLRSRREARVFLKRLKDS